MNTAVGSELVLSNSSSGNGIVSYAAGVTNKYFTFITEKFYFVID